MKKRLLFSALFLAITTVLSAAIWTVNNNNPSPGQYTTIAAAQIAASNGDTLLINGSNTNYAGTNITKSLTLLGTGYSPVKDNPHTSKISGGFTLAGSNITFRGFVILEQLYIAGGNITVSECLINGFIHINNNIAGPVFIRNNIFYYAFIALYVNHNSSVQVLIENNLFNNGSKLFSGAGLTQNGTVVRNNVFLGSNTTAFNLRWSDYYQGGANPTNWTFQNNIFWNVFITTNDCAFINNISWSPNGDANVPIINGGLKSGNINANPLFVNYNGGDIATGQDYHLQSGSPGILAGSDGTDIGMYGGPAPHTDYGGMPNIPVIQSMIITTGAVPVGGTIQVTVGTHIQN